MRVVLLLTVGLPVFAAQLVAYALPRIEVTPFVLLKRAADVSEEDQANERELAVAVELPAVLVVPRGLDDATFAAPASPEGASARALLFVKHVRRQAS